MPREQITHNELRIPVAEALMGDGTEAPQGNGRNVHVGWNANTGYVQVSVEAAREDIERLATPSDDVGYGAGGLHVWSEVLTRRDVNKLIQALRTARDKAYGRDE